MELTPNDDDSKDKEVPAADAKPPVPPLANLLNMPEKPLFASKEAEPPPPLLTPSILRIEAVSQVPPEVRAELDDDEAKEAADDDTSVPAAPPPPPPPVHKTEAPVEVEVPTPLLVEAELPPPLPPVEEVAYALPEEPRIEAWLSPPPVEAPPKPPSPPAEFAFFQREPAPEAPVPERPPEEPAVAWQRPVPQELPPADTVTRAHESSYVQPHSHEEIWRLRRNHAADILMIALGGWWLNHKINKQRKENERAFKEVAHEQQVQNTNTEFLRHQATAQGRRLEQLAYAQKQPLPEQKPAPTPEQLERLRQQVQAAEQVTAEQLASNNGLQPGQRIERSWYDEVVDREGRVVTGAIEHGRAYYEERQAEQAGYRYTQHQPDPQPVTYYDAYGNPVHPTVVHATNPLLGQTPAAPPTSLSDVQQAGAKQRNALATAALSPWVWVGLAVLLLAFFSAAAL